MIFINIFQIWSIDLLSLPSCKFDDEEKTRTCLVEVVQKAKVVRNDYKYCQVSRTRYAFFTHWTPNTEMNRKPHIYLLAAVQNSILFPKITQRKIFADFYLVELWGRVT